MKTLILTFETVLNMVKLFKIKVDWSLVEENDSPFFNFSPYNLIYLRSNDMSLGESIMTWSNMFLLRASYG